MKRWIILVFSILSYFFALSQNELDALRFSYNQYFGTSRSMGMANAFSALGADPGSFVINPAAIALAKFSDASISMGFKMNKSYSSFYGNTQDDFKYNFQINHLSFIFTKRQEGQDLKFVNFGFSYNRINDFNRRIYVKGVNPKGSMLDFFTFLANGRTPEQLDPSTRMAFDTYLIDTLPGTNNTYVSPNMFIDDTIYNETQRKIEESSGHSGSFDFLLGLNFRDKIFIGASLSILSMRYEMNSTFTEMNFPDPVELDLFNFTERLRNEVSGYGVKLGITLAPVNFLRIGMAAHSPYFLRVKDVYNSSIDSHWKTPDSEGNYDYYAQSDVNVFYYRITTPLRFTGGVGLILGKFMLLDAEYEYVDYKTIRMSSEDYNFGPENESIDTNFNTTYNLRLGAEFNIGGFQLRGGFAKYGAPYSSVSDQYVYAAGLGYRTSNIYFDLAFNIRQRQQEYKFYIPYTDEQVPQVALNDYYLSFTIGIKLNAD